MGRVALAMAWLAATLWAPPARADKWSETLDISVSSRFAWLTMQREMQVALGAKPIDVLMRSRPHLRGQGVLMGGIARLGFTLEGARFGIGSGIVTATNIDFLHAPLGDNLSAKPGALWGVPVEGYLGYTLGDPSGVRGLFEIRGAFTMLQAQVTVKDRALGELGDTRLSAYLGSLELRAGLRLPIGSFVYAEAGVGISPLPSDIAPERGSVFFTVGLPIPTSHAF